VHAEATRDGGATSRQVQQGCPQQLPLPTTPTPSCRQFSPPTGQE